MKVAFGTWRRVLGTYFKDKYTFSDNSSILPIFLHWVVKVSSGVVAHRSRRRTIYNAHSNSASDRCDDSRKMTVRLEVVSQLHPLLTPTFSLPCPPLSHVPVPRIHSLRCRVLLHTPRRRYFEVQRRSPYSSASIATAMSSEEGTARTLWSSAPHVSEDLVSREFGARPSNSSQAPTSCGSQGATSLLRFVSP